MCFFEKFRFKPGFFGQTELYIKYTHFKIYTYKFKNKHAKFYKQTKSH